MEDSNYRKIFDKYYEGIKYVDHINLIKENNELCKGIIGLIKKIVDYLAFNRLIHIEKQIRELACETLALLVPFHPEIFVNDIIPKLMKSCTSPSLHVRHGSLIGICTILLGINGLWDYHHKSRINRRQMLNGLTA